MKTALFDRLKDLFAELTGKNKFGKPDFVLLKTMMMLAAMDGEIADDEVDRFRELAAKCRAYSGESFETLWDTALRSAGYLLLQSRFLGHDELVAAFVAEAEKDQMKQSNTRSPGSEQAFIILSNSFSGFCVG